MEQKLYEAATKLPETGLSFESIQPSEQKKYGKRGWSVVAAMAACLALLLSIGFVGVEAKAYNDAVMFFREHGLPTEGLSRGEIKAVYRDITTKSFTYSKTAEVIGRSLSSEQIAGYEIMQENPTSEDIENLWNYKNNNKGFLYSWQVGIHYEYHSDSSENGSFLEKYDGDTLLWRVATDFQITGYSTVSDGVIAYGEIYKWSNPTRAGSWMAKIDEHGDLVWQRQLRHRFDNEYIAAVLENGDGSYAVFSRGDLRYLCLGQYTAEGVLTTFHMTEIGNYGIWNAARLGDGYIVQLGSYMSGEHARIVKVDPEGNITDSFSYSSEDAYYYITDMLEFDGKIYLSAYAVPKLADEDQSAGGRYEIEAVLDYLFENGLWEISSEELTPLVRDNYTAILLVCDPGVGTPQEFYSVKGSLGGKLAISDTEKLLWDVESIATTFFSPATSSFTIGGTSYVFRYAFGADGTLISQEKTGEIVPYRR